MILAVMVGLGAVWWGGGSDAAEPTAIAPPQALPLASGRGAQIADGHRSEETPDQPLHRVDSPVEPTGRRAPILDQEDEDAWAAASYRDRIERNILSLEEAADTARSEGNEARAALMERRIAGLERRLDELESAPRP